MVPAARLRRHDRTPRALVLTHGRGGDDVLVRLQRETLLDRFPLRTPRFRRAWDDAARRIVAHGRGVVVFAEAGDDVEDVVAPLVRAHLEDRRAIALDLDGDDPRDRALVRAACERGS
jgi:hypothetical protein